MGELTGLSILICLGAAAIVLLLVLVSHVLWWRKDAYFPSASICGGAHDRFHFSNKAKKQIAGLAEDSAEIIRLKGEERFWHNIAFRLLAQVPPELSISGFFSAIVWPVFVLLNVLLLAQVVGTMVGVGGGVIDINPFGTYSAIPLVTAVLYAVAQSVFGIMYGETDRKDKKRYVALALLLLAILLEGGLAVYRAWLIAQGNPDVHPGDNMIDNFLGGRFGLVVGGFFGILFPAAHAALGYVAFPQFVRPAIRYAFHAVGGVCVLFLALVNYLLLAWHPIHPKDRDDEDIEKRIEEEVKKRTSEAIQQSNLDAIEEWKKSELPEIIAEARQQWEQERQQPPPAQPSDILLAENLSEEEKRQWFQIARLRDEAKDLSAELEQLQVRLPVNPQTILDTLAKADQLRDDWLRVAWDGKQLLVEASKLNPDSLALKVADFELQHGADHAQSEEAPAASTQTLDAEDSRKQAVLEKAISKGKSRLGPLYAVANSREKLGSALSGVENLKDKVWRRAQSDGKALLKDIETHQMVFRELVKLLKSKEIDRPGLKQEKLIELRDGTLKRLRKRFDELQRPGSLSPCRLDFDTLEGLVEKCETLMRGVESVTVPTDAELQAMKKNLDEKPGELVTAYLSALRLFTKTEREIEERIKRVEGRPRWFYSLADLLN